MWRVNVRVLFYVTLMIAGTTPAEEMQFEVSATKYLMGTLVEIKAMHPNVEACRTSFYHAFHEMERVEHLLSSHLPESEIARINAHASEYPVKVSAETFAILERAIHYAEQTNGLFDVTIGVLSKRWGFSGEDEITLPYPEEIEPLRAKVDYHQLDLNAADTTVAFAIPGMQIDLGGIAKGYAIDRAAATLREQGITDFLINAGGDIYASGFKFEDQRWVIGIKHPRQPEALLAKLEITNSAIATSGDYERYTIIDDIRYHHILDPRTGYPARQCQSVTVLAPTAETADVMATFFFVVGDSLLSIHPKPEYPYLRIDESGNVHLDSTLVHDYHLEFFPTQQTYQTQKSP